MLKLNLFHQNKKYKQTKNIVKDKMNKFNKYKIKKQNLPLKEKNEIYILF